MKVLLAALVAVVLVSPALAQKSTTDNPDLLVPACITDEEIIKNAPAGAKLVKKLTAEEVKSFLAKAKIEGDLDGVSIYLAPQSAERGNFVFFTFKDGCVKGSGSGTMNSFEGLITPDKPKGDEL